jgi:hypothetical protein
MTMIMLLSVLISQVTESGDQLSDNPAVILPEPRSEVSPTGETLTDRDPDGEVPVVDEPSVIIVRKKSPSGALLRSSVLPGWGQFYNDEPFKGVILGTVELGLMTWLISEHIQAEDARTDFLLSGDPADEARYEEHSQRRIDLIWYTSAAWLYGMLDAYVDAYLYSFDTENRSFERDAGIGVVVFIPF